MAMEKRRAFRILLNKEVALEAISMPRIELHENLRQVYERVEPNPEDVGRRFRGEVRDLSTNGAFLAGEPAPLLTRVACRFELEGFGPVEAIGWTLWRRLDDCEVPGPDGRQITLPRGFGVLFESIPLDARISIHKLVSRAKRGVS